MNQTAVRTVRAPRGPWPTCLGWPQEAAMRMKGDEPGESQQEETEGDRRARMESDAEARFEEIQEDHSDH